MAQLELELHRASQCDRILALLREAKKWRDEDAAWVPLPDILRLGIASFTRRISDLRLAGFVIENKRETAEDGQVHSWYRLLKEPQ